MLELSDGAGSFAYQFTDGDNPSSPGGAGFGPGGEMLDGVRGRWGRVLESRRGLVRDGAAGTAGGRPCDHQPRHQRA